MIIETHFEHKSGDYLMVRNIALGLFLVLLAFVATSSTSYATFERIEHDGTKFDDNGDLSDGFGCDPSSDLCWVEYKPTGIIGGGGPSNGIWIPASSVGWYDVTNIVETPTGGGKTEVDFTLTGSSVMVTSESQLQSYY